MNLDSSQSNTNIFKANKAFRDGGAIYLNDADGDLLNRNVTINNAHFIQNEAVGKGGAIYVNRNETVTISNTKFEGNKATNGAAININKGTVLIDENVTFDDNEGAEDIYFSGSSGNLEFNDFGEITLENGISAASSSDAFIVTLSSNSSDSQLKIGKDSDSILKNVAVELGDKTKAIDPEFFGEDYEEEVIITELSDMLDDPSKNSVKVQNFKNQFQDLFQKITATVQQTQYNVGSYEKGAALMEASSAAKAEFLTSAINDASAFLAPGKTHDVVWDNSGITVTDRETPTNQVKIVGGAMLFSAEDPTTKEQTWVTGVTN